MAIDFVYDRTLQDVERWRELRDKGLQGMTYDEEREWRGLIDPTPTPSATKGMYTHNDMNRVESAVVSIAARLTELGYTVPALTTKTNWTTTDLVTKSDMERYFSNVEKLRKISGVLPDTPPTPTIYSNFDYVKANNLEKILEDIVTVIGGIS